MDNFLCHLGLIFTADELYGETETAPESIPRELTESLEQGKEDEMPD
jgi:hypothetical protein